MTLQQTIQANSSKTNELFDKLQNTSDQAIKTRESLFSDLSSELRLYAQLEERHLFPALRDSEETRGLAAAAATANKELRVQLDELEALPKGDKSFLPRLARLRKHVREHAKDERRDLLPAAGKALSEDKAEAVARKIEAGFAEADIEQRVAAEEQSQAAKRAREQAEAIVAGKQKVTDAVDSTRQTASDLGHDAVDAVKRGVQSVEDLSHKVADEVADVARRAKDGVSDSVTAFRQTARESGEDLKAVKNALGAFAEARSDLRALAIDALKRSARNGIDTSKRILRNPRKIGSAQRTFVATVTRNLVETTTELLQIARNASSHALRPVEQRLRAVS